MCNLSSSRVSATFLRVKAIIFLFLLPFFIETVAVLKLKSHCCCRYRQYVISENLIAVVYVTSNCCEINPYFEQFLIFTWVNSEYWIRITIQINQFQAYHLWSEPFYFSFIFILNLFNYVTTTALLLPWKIQYLEHQL